MLDIICWIITFAYVGIIFFISEKVFDSESIFSRKFLHIMMGFLIFIMPFYSSNLVMAVFVTLPIAIVLFFMTDYSPIKIMDSGTTHSGHNLGLFYYALIWTILLFIIPDNNLVIVGLAIASMSFGDGFASVIGGMYGSHNYNITGDNKTVEGSVSMFVAIFIFSFIIVGFYTLIGCNVQGFSILNLIIVAAVATIVEAVTPKGLDNIAVPLSTAILYSLFIILI
ncbi:MAG: SEC59/DGK1/VTE5 family protein [Methanobacteriaceae archaeon]|nr:SEC59/DGK1/VTE5 family protein [Methanobacteriaceae archaeon]